MIIVAKREREKKNDTLEYKLFPLSSFSWFAQFLIPMQIWAQSLSNNHLKFA